MPTRDNLPHLRNSPRILRPPTLARRNILLEPPLLSSRQRQTDEFLPSRAGRVGVLQHGGHEAFEELAVRSGGWVAPGEVERFGYAGEGERAEEEFEGFGCLQDGLRGVVVGEGEAEVGFVWGGGGGGGGSGGFGVADEDGDDVVGEFGWEGWVGEMFEGELEFFAVHVPEAAHEELVVGGEAGFFG